MRIAVSRLLPVLFLITSASLFAQADSLGVMLQLDNMLPDNNDFGARSWEVDRQFELLERAGVRWVRAGIGWEQIEAKKGQWFWNSADLIVQSAKNHHINLVWLLGNTAPWDSNNNDWNGVPKDLSDPNGHFVQFVQQLAGRYSQDVHYWEIRNEPNLEYQWHGTSADLYATYLTQAYTTIKSIDPTAQVIFGGLGGEVPQEVSWFKLVIASLKSRGALLPFDVLNFHVYGMEADSNGFTGKGSVSAYLAWADSQIQAAQTATGLTGLPVWFTEFDYPAN